VCVCVLTYPYHKPCLVSSDATPSRGGDGASIAGDDGSGVIFGTAST
jgi:hypothetical protein